MSSCIFCEIIAGRQPAVLLHENETTLSFLDIRQSNDGHCLVVSRDHYPMIDDLPPEIAGALFAHAALIAQALREAVTPDGIQLWQSNGRAAGQEVDHVHLHVFPRYYGDGHFRIYPSTPRLCPADELDAIAAPIRASLGRITTRRRDG